MEKRTRDHIGTARANQQYSVSILNDATASETELNWAAVAAFYAAMHAVNAYLWEIARLEPASHRDRRAIVGHWPDLSSLQHEYMALFDMSLHACYTPGYAVKRSRLETLIRRHLTRVITTIEQALPSDE